MSDKSSSSSGGIGFLGVLTIVFVVLKLTHNIAWSWLWVFSPLWIGFGLSISLFVLFFIGAMLLSTVRR